MESTFTGADGGSDDDKGARVTLQVRPERRLIPHEASERHVDLLVRVDDAPDGKRPERPPLTLALVLDRSGSMSGDKIATAKRAAVAVLQRLDERDTIAVVVFDDHIDAIQPRTRVTDAVKAHVSAELERIGARGTTALHEGWLTGCNAIVNASPGDERAEPERGVARCFLLTDGLANVGLTDPEQIASQAGGIRKKAGIGTSTFGIGADYAEELLGPMAEAGGGRFHHLRTSEEISATFVNELGELLATAAANVELDLEVEPRVDVEFISTYRSRHSAEQPTNWTIALGDLMSGEERHTVVRLGFAETWRREEQAIRARVRWMAEGAERSTDWQEFRFTYASDAECEAEPQDAEVMRWAGQHQADRAQREALRLSKRGNLAGAGAALVSAYRAISAYTGNDAVLTQELAEIEDLKQQIARAPLPSMSSKERYMAKQAKTSGQRDLRTKKPDDTNKPGS
jgi:Ca-activated chloride channel homolog